MKIINLILIILIIILYFNNNYCKYKENFKTKNLNIKLPKYLVTFVYFETEKSKINLDFFIKNAIFKNKDVLYNIIIKNKKYSVEIPKLSNINIIETDNDGYDFGGYSDSLQNINISEFDYFIFLNDTVRGPFTPNYIDKSIWYKYYTSLLNNKIKLVGSTINHEIHKHVQSMSFATDKIGLDILIKNNIFNKQKAINSIKISKSHLIHNFEVMMSKIIIDNGYDINSYQLSNNKKLVTGDIAYENGYFGTTINPIEIMFMKTNRFNNIKILDNYTKWNM